MPIMWCLANPKIGEREVVAALLEHNHHLIRTGQILLADKGFAAPGLSWGMALGWTATPISQVMSRQQPLDLPQVDVRSCLTCVAANVLYMSGITDAPDPRWVDREVGREPGCGAQRIRVRCLLLQQGLSLHLVCAYQPERFLQEGLEYLRSYYRQEWDSSWEQFWTRQRLERHRRECLAARELSMFGTRMRTEHRQPTLADIHGALDRGHLVWVSVDNDWGEVDCHAVLIYGRRGEVFDVYSPEVARGCLQQYRRRRLDRVWLRSEGMTVVWRRAP